MRKLYFFALASGLLGLAACGPAPVQKLPDLKLPNLAKEISPSLASCPTAKCLTVYVAPWCGYCRAGTPKILALREYLRKMQVTTRIIVGMDEHYLVEDMARGYGPDTLLDPGRSFEFGGGVPHFFVSNPAGDILKEVPGLPRLSHPAEIAAYFGLP